jgi:hypothetical protein
MEAADFFSGQSFAGVARWRPAVGLKNLTPTTTGVAATSPIQLRG